WSRSSTRRVRGSALERGMKQLKWWAVGPVLGICAGVWGAAHPVHADPWDTTAAGRSTIRLSAMGAVPLFQVDWCNSGRGDNRNANAQTNGHKYIYPAFSAALGFEHFVCRGLSLGIDASVQYHCSYPNNTYSPTTPYYYLAIPVALTAGYTVAFWRIRLPLTVGAGFNYQHYYTSTYYGLVLKAAAGCYFQLTEHWSLGVSATYSGVPRSCEKIIEEDRQQTNTRTAQFIAAGVDVRYHL
ncbi:hypothetical protein, partial [Treponema pallidum]|uniref:hypothetical protein n=2 Tax=Treponema pallidum TaxID=160 RepID=UPI0035D3FDA9